jgi:hypothetical protein
VLKPGLSMKSRCLITIFTFYFLVLLACHKDGQKPGSSEYFPNEIGDSWVYDVTDSTQSSPGNPSSPSHYAVTVTITGIKRLLDGKEAAIWEYQYPVGNETNYLRITGDTIKVFDNTYSRTMTDLNFPRQIFLLPFQVNQSWKGKLYDADSTKVIEKADVRIGAQTFTGCYHIYRHYSGPNIELNDHYWFKPDIGMVTIYKKDFNFGPTLYSTWQLKSFSVH